MFGKIQLELDELPEGSGLDPQGDIQVPSPMNRNLFGTKNLNAVLQLMLNPPAELKLDVERFGTVFLAGDKVIQTRNNFGHDVFNGNIGRIREITTEPVKIRVVFDDRREVEYEPGELDELQLAYAITIHTSQGSEFFAVVIPVSMQHYVMLQQNLLFTGVTRGKRVVVLIGEKKGLAMAVRNREKRHQHGGLRWRLVKIDYPPFVRFRHRFPESDHLPVILELDTVSSMRPMLRFLPFFLAGVVPIRPALAIETAGFFVEQALVHHLEPDERHSKFPVIMIPGLNLSSYIFLTTPDGRDGWAQQFAGAGHEVFVINDPRFDFSRGFRVPGFCGVPKEGAPPVDDAAEKGWQRDVWRRWGFGQSEGKPYRDGQFPTNRFDEFEKNFPYVSRSNADFAAAIIALLERIGPAILMAHSAAGPRAVSAAKAHPEWVAGLVMLEPTGPPVEADFPRLSGIAMLGVYGDYIESRRQAGRKVAVENAAELFQRNGGVGEVLSLPEDRGAKGNSHLMMQDRNSAAIAGEIIDWLNRNAKVPQPVAGESWNKDSTQTRPSAGADPFTGGKGRFRGGAKGGGKGSGKGKGFRRAAAEED